MTTDQELAAALTKARSQPTPEQAVAAFTFFYREAPWACTPPQSSEDGRRETAERLASAEQWAREQGITFEWELDPEAENGEIKVAAFSATGEYLDSCGMVDCETDVDWHRVIQAQVADSIRSADQ